MPLRHVAQGTSVQAFRTQHPFVSQPILKIKSSGVYHVPLLFYSRTVSASNLSSPCLPENDFGSLRFSCSRFPRHNNRLVGSFTTSAQTHLVIRQLTFRNNKQRDTKRTIIAKWPTRSFRKASRVSRASRNIEEKHTQKALHEDNSGGEKHVCSVRSSSR